MNLLHALILILNSGHTSDNGEVNETHFKSWHRLKLVYLMNSGEHFTSTTFLTPL